MGDLEREKHSDVEITSTQPSAVTDTAAARLSGPKAGANPADIGKSIKPRGPPRSQQLNKLYPLPTPLRTFPLPTFVPHNPISLLHIVATWTYQLFYRPSSHPERPYEGLFSPETCSVHITDPATIRALWSSGFYGKGSLSRSEPSWLDREKRRAGADANKTSEEYTKQRRADRQSTKWERARKEREAIDLRLSEEQRVEAEEARALSKHDVLSWCPPAPTGPDALLKLPNSRLDLLVLNKSAMSYGSSKLGDILHDALPGQDVDVPQERRLLDGPRTASQPSEKTSPKSDMDIAESVVCADSMTSQNPAANDSAVSPRAKSQKSVHFSPTIEHSTFVQGDPPSPNLAPTAQEPIAEPAIEDREHLQLTMEEAFFLSYGLGVLSIRRPQSTSPSTAEDMFTLFRQSSYFRPHDFTGCRPDDPFLVSYVVYHHFRSLGWVVRGGTKFAVDYLLYNRGPPFSHAEFSILVLPSYSDPYWSRDEATRTDVLSKQSKRWSWIHCVNRVNSQVKKTLVLVYVDVPSPTADEEDERLGISGLLARYKVREFVMKRWQANRTRD